MTAELNHTIVHSRDRRVSAAFVAAVLGIDVAPDWGPFSPVHLSNGVSLDYVDAGDEITSQHYAFLVSDNEFDQGLARILDGGHQLWADPHQGRPGEINHNYGGRGVYFHDPDGHLLELMTVPYGAAPE
jgi:catechol 2,3-dioxygenase-like lactoylglutathione lyase family enzyme